MTRLIRIALVCASTMMVSAFAQATTVKPAPPAAAPTDLRAVAGNARVVLTWTGVAGVTKYKVYRGATHDGESATAIATVTATTFTNSSLTNGNSYFYKVAAFNEGGAGPLSNEATGIPVAAPAGLTATAGDTRVISRHVDN
jgi:cellulose 1,4-beta-cellobiosidase